MYIIINIIRKVKVNHMGNMAAKIPGAKKVVIPNAGHAANIDQPEAFNAAIRDFLAGLKVA